MGLYFDTKIHKTFEVYVCNRSYLVSHSDKLWDNDSFFMGHPLSENHLIEPEGFYKIVACQRHLSCSDFLFDWKFADIVSHLTVNNVFTISGIGV